MTTKRSIFSFLLVILAALFFVACDEPPVQQSADVKQQQAQEQIQKQGVAEVGMPGIVNFTEMKALKELYELRDQARLLTYTYTQDMEGRMHYKCDSIGYPFPYATQYSSPSKVVHHADLGQYYGDMLVPQAEPNGLFMPGSADGTWVRCIVPGGGGKVSPVYIEDKVQAYPWKLRNAINDSQ